MKKGERLAKIKQMLTNNWGVKLTSFIIAFVLWFVVVQIDDPIESVSFGNIQVNLINSDLLSGENKVFGVVDGTDTVRVTVKAPKSTAGKLRSTDIVAEADVSKLTDINTVAITCSVPGFDVESVSSNRDFVKLEIENRKSKYIKIEPEVSGDVEEGFIISSITADQNLVEVSGAESVIDRVKYGKVSIDVSGATSTVSANVDIQLFDAEGRAIDVSRTAMNVPYVHMSVTVLETKEVPVILNYSGTPAEGYIDTGEVSVSPSSIVIAAPSKNLPVVNRLVIPAEKVDITDATSDYKVVIEAEEILPKGCIIADNNKQITGVVYIEPVFEKGVIIQSSNIKIINVPEGMDVKFGEGNWNLSIGVSGLKNDVLAFDVSKFVATVDIKAWMDEHGMTELEPGEYWITASYANQQNVSLIEPGEVPIVVTYIEEE